MFDYIYTELTCPFCGHEYKYSPPSYEKAKADLDEWRIDAERDVADKAGFAYKIWYADLTPEQIDAKLQGMNSPESIQTYISRRDWGLCEVQTKEFACVMDEYFIGDTVDYAHYGRYCIQESFTCKGCCYESEHKPYRSVSVWIDIAGREIIGVSTTNPETGKPERREWKESFQEVVRNDPDMTPEQKSKWLGAK